MTNPALSTSKDLAQEDASLTEKCLWCQRLQWASLASAIIAICMIAVFGTKNQWFIVPGTISITIVVMTFLIRIVPIAIKVGTSFVGASIFLLLNAHIAIVALILAKAFISEALRLPPEDFPITTSVLTLWGVIGIWMVLAGIVLAAASGFAPLTSFFSQLVKPMAFLFEASRKKPNQAIGREARKAAAWADRLGYTMIGALFTAMVLMVGGASISQLATPSAIRMLAFAADYENAPDYPGVGDFRIRLHNNGIVSYATCSNWTVQIRVGNYSAPKNTPDFPPSTEGVAPSMTDPIQNAAMNATPTESFWQQCKKNF